MKQYPKIDLYTCHRSSNFHSGYTDYQYQCSTIQHKTLREAILSLNDTPWLLEGRILFLRQCPAGKVGIVENGNEKVLAIFDRGARDGNS